MVVAPQCGEKWDINPCDLTSYNGLFSHDIKCYFPEVQISILMVLL